jgi:predicted DNA-binding protein (UPF0251 family)
MSVCEISQQRQGKAAEILQIQRNPFWNDVKMINN